MLNTPMQIQDCNERAVYLCKLMIVGQVVVVQDKTYIYRNRNSEWLENCSGEN